MCQKLYWRGSAQGSLVQRELSAKLTEGLLQYSVPVSPETNADLYIFPRNPSAPSGHLPLHKGGFAAVLPSGATCRFRCYNLL